ncbi:16591_t:CDS:2 [Cetraspora pellucida]|uniref:16591_t:CDS:1 n=1 Tax=Cetraspora pellucida TaxID=1433469 RepID=A0ACA9KVA5_9GLOM|nr:16591_t:CDS:2 [Cetraspora pellucida]
MSTNRPSRHHGFRGYAADHDRLKRALLQPVQSWVKKWQYPANGGKNFEILKWTKSDKKLTFNDADESGIVTTTRQQVNSEDTPTPTASIIQPPTEASTPQPSETEPDSSFSRPPFAKATSLLRQASLTSAVSTPGENLNSNNNNTPHEIESSKTIITKNENLKFSNEVKKVGERIEMEDLYDQQADGFGKNQKPIDIEFEQPLKGPEYEGDNNEEFRTEEEDAEEDYDEPIEEYDEQPEDYGERTDGYERQINEYPDTVEGYGEQNSEYEGPSSDYGGPSTEYTGRTNQYKVREHNDEYDEVLSDYDEHSSEYDEQASEYEEQASEFMEQTEGQTEHITYQGQVTTQMTAYIDRDKEISAETKSTEDGEIEEEYEYLEDL